MRYTCDVQSLMRDVRLHRYVVLDFQKEPPKELSHGVVQPELKAMRSTV